MATAIDLIIRILAQGNARAEINTISGAVGALKSAVGALAGAWAGVKSASAFMKTGAEFNQAIVSLGALTGQSGENLELLKEKVLATAKSMNLFAGDVAKAMGVIGSEMPQLLTMPDALNEVTKAALTLAKASRAVGDEMSNAEAAAALAAGLNQWQAGFDQSARFMNVLAAGAKEGSSLITQTADAMKNAGTTAAAAGLSFEQFNAIIQVMAARQLKGAEAGTALRNILLKMSTEGDKFAEFGIAADSVNPKIVGVQTALQNLAPILTNDTALVKIFGTENINAAKIIGSASQQIGELTEKLTETQTAYEQADAGSQAFNAQVEAVQNNIKNTAAAVFEQLSPALVGTVIEFGGAISVVGELVEKFGALIPVLTTLPQLISGISFVATLAQSLNYTVLLTGAWASLQALLASTTAAVSAFAAALAPLAAPIIAAAAAAAGAVAIYSAWSEASNEAAENAKKHAEALAEVNKETAAREKVGQTLENLAKLDSKSAAEMKQSLIDRLSTLESMKAQMDAMKDAGVTGVAGPDPEIYQQTESSIKKLRAELGGLKSALADANFQEILTLNDQLIAAEDKRTAAVKKLETAQATAAEKTKQLDEQVTQRKLSNSEKVLAKARKSLEDALKAEEEYAEKVKDLRKSLTDEQMSDADRLRAMRQKQMTDEGKEEDRQLQAQEKLSAARAAMQIGDMENAKKLSSQAKDIAEGLTDVDMGESLFQQAAEVSQQASEEMIADAEETQAQLQDILTGKEEMAKATIDISEAETEIERLKVELESIQDKHITVTADMQVNKPPGYASGGAISGYGGGDIIPALLEPGEFVVRKERARQFYALLQAINAGAAGRVSQLAGGILRFASGGSVPAAAQTAQNFGGFTITLNTASGARRETLLMNSDSAKRLAGLFAGLK